MSVTTSLANPVVGVCFNWVGKMYHFDASGHPQLAAGDRVIVNTRRGIQMGEVAKVLSEPSTKKGGRKLKKIVRMAAPRDLVQQQAWQVQAPEALASCRRVAADLKLKGVRYHRAEYNFDGSKLTFYYSIIAEKSSGVGRMLSELRKAFPDCDVEMVKIGQRDVAKLLGGIGACSGQLCCRTFLTEFNPITIKMAKAQGISLNPDNISGMCGRLRCCLLYEYDQYLEARKQLPKIKKQVGTPHGAGRVVALKPLADTATVDVDGRYYDVRREDIVPWKEYEALKAKAAVHCSRHPSGGCSCPTRGD
ncbi:MAG TPA: regulatory iron-sulfur-containing complex subunit RicT [Anaerolineales bacterium]|jgi:cell fate regulator YaaT (PSP1 superfamily)|nr:regulatory iron-sulfur-containing complex subunit RicT [Anaerolineales bacterium]